MKRFKRIYLEISNICNLQCSFCPEVERAKWKIEKEKFLERLDQIKPLAERVCFHVMGEPLGHPLFPEFVRLAREREVAVEITTNGTLLSESAQEALLNPAVVQVNFSLQSFFDNFPGASSETYLGRIFQFCRRAFETRPDLYVNLRLWNLGLEEKSSRENEFILSRVEKEFSVAINRQVDPGFKKSKRVVNRLYLHFDSRFEWPRLNGPFKSASGRCGGGTSHVAVLSEGDVVPCCLDKEAVISLGNMDEKPLLEILETQRLKDLREGFEKGERRESLCQHCDYAGRFSKKSRPNYKEATAG